MCIQIVIRASKKADDLCTFRNQRDLMGISNTPQISLIPWHILNVMMIKG